VGTVGSIHFMVDLTVPVRAAAARLEGPPERAKTIP
jgi:hypothetical protein